MRRINRRELTPILFANIREFRLAKISVKGFTLIEFLLAASILSIIAAALVSTFAGGVNVYRRLQGYNQTQVDILISLEKLERDLRNMYEFSEIDFIGEEKSVSFAGLVRVRDDEENQNLVLGRISYYLDENEGILVKREQDYSQALSESDTGATETLAFIEDINFSYYYYDPEIQDYDWKTPWEEVFVKENEEEEQKENIPLGIKVEALFKDGERVIVLNRTILIPIPVSRHIVSRIGYVEGEA